MKIRGKRKSENFWKSSAFNFRLERGPRTILFDVELFWGALIDPKCADFSKISLLGKVVRRTIVYQLIQKKKKKRKWVQSNMYSLLSAFEEVLENFQEMSAIQIIFGNGKSLFACLPLHKVSEFVFLNPPIFLCATSKENLSALNFLNSAVSLDVFGAQNYKQKIELRLYCNLTRLPLLAWLFVDYPPRLLIHHYPFIPFGHLLNYTSS